MPSAANGKSEKPAPSEALDNSPVRQIMTIVEHKIRNLEKRKSKLTSYRDLQKAGKELKLDQKIAVAKFDEVNQTLEFARELSKQITAVAVSAEREEKKKAKKDAWLRYAAETDKIREALIIVDCLNQMGSSEAREDFLSGTNGAAKLSEADLKVLDDLYPEVTAKHEPNEEGKPGFPAHVARAAEHLCSIVDGRAKEALGTTYTHIRQIVRSVQESGYFDKVPEQEVEEVIEEVEEEEVPPAEPPAPAPAPAYPAPPAPGSAVPYPPCPPCPPCLPPITLQEVEHAYFAHQYPQQPPPRPLAEVIGSQNFFFLQESELDSPGGTPAPLAMPLPLQVDAALVPTQTFTNQHFVLRAATAGPGAPPAAALPCPPCFPPAPQPAAPVAPAPAPAPQPDNSQWDEGSSPDRDDAPDRKSQPAGDARVYSNNNGGARRYNNRAPRPTNGYRGGRGGYTARPAGDYREPRAAREGYAPRQYGGDGYRGRSKDGGAARGDSYYGNGDSGNGASDGDARGERYDGGAARYEGGFKSRGRGGPRGPSTRGQPAPRGPRAQHYRNKPDVAE